MKRRLGRGDWVCECNFGWCDFKTKREAVEARNGTFCGKWIGLEKRKKTTEGDK